MDFQTSNDVSKLKRFCRSCTELIQLEFSISCIFKTVKPTLTVSLLTFCLLEIIVRPFISLITKFEVCNGFGF